MCDDNALDWALHLYGVSNIAFRMLICFKDFSYRDFLDTYK